MPVLSSARRVLGAVAALALVAVASPLAPAGASPAAPPRPAGAVAVSAPAPAPVPADARWGEFVDATDTSLRLTQPDGTLVHAKLTDAAVGGALEVGGFSIVKDGSGWWRYAAARGASGLEAGPARVGVDAPPAGLAAGIGRIADVWQRGDGTDVRAELLRQLQTASREASLRAAAGGGPRVFRFPVVLFATWYDPELGQTAPQFQEGNGVEHYEAILDGFGGNPTGTLTEFYFENSYGQFLVQVDVLAQPNGDPYVSTRSSAPGDEGRCYYGGIDPPEDPLDDLDPLDQVIGAGGGGALGMGLELFYSTTLAVDHPFADYDNDGDGSVDFMGIIHSGAEMAVTGDPCNTWSHAIAVSSFTGLAGDLIAELAPDLPIPVPDTNLKVGIPIPGQTVTFDRLFTMPEFETRQGVLTIGVAAHEMAHALGEPDYYGTDGSTSGSGDWDVMSGGSYGGTPSGSNPTWFNPQSRVFQGWVTPTIVHEDTPDYRFHRRSSTPDGGYAVGEPNPNLVLVPTRWVEEGDETSDGHVWTANDLYGLPLDGDNGYVIEGWYLELASRMPVRAPAIHEEMTRASYFDRWLYGSGLLTWHFDYWRRSNVLYGQNGGNNDPNRMQMDVEEWDFNDDTQEIALNRNRAEASDVAWEAATGITSGTHRSNPSAPGQGEAGDPQGPIEIPSGPVTLLTPYRYEFDVEDLPGNHTMRVAINTDLIGDCTLQLFSGEEGAEKAETDLIDTGSFGGPEEAIITEPVPGRWVAEIGDFAGCLSASGSISFEGPSGFDATGTADTWSNEDQAPTGWAFTNIRTGGAEGLSHGTDAGGADTLTVDLLDLTGASDYSPGFVRGVTLAEDGRRGLTAGADNELEVLVFSNGDDDGAEGTRSVGVRVHEGSADGPVVSQGTMELGAFSSTAYPFSFDPGREGPVDLYVEVDPTGAVAEGSEDNNLQKTTLWAGPADPSVLVVDDDGPGDTEQLYAGALAALGIPYAVADKHVTVDQLDAYDAVIWVSTLDRGAGQLDEDDRSVIASYLEGGGNLWLSSNRAIEALGLSEAVDFGEQWFGVRSIDIDSFYRTVQMQTEDILGDGTIGIDVLPGRPFVDKYDLTPDTANGTVTSLGILQGSGTPADDETTELGARVDGDGFKTVVSSFNLSQVSEPGDAIDFVEAVMDHFGVAGGQYAVTATDPIVYHVQPRQSVANVDLPVKAIVLGGTPGQPVTLFYRHHALGEYVALPMAASGSDGAYLARIPAADVTPDGLDYYLKAGAASTFVPRMAEGGSVASAIAVFMPEGSVMPTPAPTPTPTPAPAPTPRPSAGGGGRLPATGGESLAVLGALGLLAGLGVRRLGRRVA